MASRLKAKAVVAVRKRREEASQEALEAVLLSRLMAKVDLPIAKDGKDGRNGPQMADILAEVIPLIPKPKIEHTTIREAIDKGDMEAMIEAILASKLPKEDPTMRPKVELIREEIDPEKLKGLVTQKELDKTLQRIQAAIEQSSGGGGLRQITNVIEVRVDTTIKSSQLETKQINVILVLTAGITVTLPAADATKIVWVQQGYIGDGEFTICKAV